MKQNYSLRKKLTILMALMLFLQSLSLVASLMLSRVFLMLDAEAFRLFNNASITKMQTINENVATLVGSMANQTNMLNSELQSIAKANNTPSELLYLNDSTYSEVSLTGTDTLIDLIQNNLISGAFLFLNGSNTNPESSNAHSALYIRSATPGGNANTTSDFLLELGPISVSRHYRIPTSTSWNIELLFAEEDRGPNYDFYFKPMQAAIQENGAEIERYGYWSLPTNMLNDNQKIVCYTLPLLDDSGKPFGVLGIEISLPLFTKYYLSNVHLPYANSFYAIAPLSGETLSMDWYIPSGALAQVYLQQGKPLSLRKVPSVGLYETTLNGLGEMFCSVYPLTIYSKNSPFYEETWSLVGFVKQDSLRESSSSVRKTLIASIITTTIIAFVAIFLLVYTSTRKISGLSKYVAGLSPHQDIHFERTGLREIDDLTTAVEALNNRVINASKTTSKILELTLLPIGGFEITNETNQVVLTEYIYSLIKIKPSIPVSKEEWGEIYTNLTSHPAETYPNVFKYKSSLYEDECWLRILETNTTTGQVGIILDVTKEIEEHRRLAHELDLDALTHLYNRKAFIREAEKRIQEAATEIGVMIFSDLDNLKYVNDTFGHDTGDRLIIQAAEMFHNFKNWGGVVSRISGDEFAIYLHGFSSKDAARDLLVHQFKENERLSFFTPDGNSHRIRISSGIAWYPDDANNLTDLLKLSDFAMYEAKHNQKGSIFEFNKDSYNKNAYLLENREAINLLLDGELIHFAFQPIVDLKTGEIYAYEALMRPLLENFKSPVEIISVAAAQSKLGRLERLVMMIAFRSISEHAADLNGVKVFINSIPSQSLSEEDILYLEQRYAQFFPQVVIEITEAENNSLQHFNNKLSFIQRNRMMLAIDDFGSGNSNELRILSLQPNIIKIDMQMIQGIHNNEDKQKLVANLVSFCRPKGIVLVAEGVECSEDLSEIIRLGVDHVQGYYIGRPNFSFTHLDPAVKNEILQLNKAHAQITSFALNILLCQADQGLTGYIGNNGRSPDLIGP